MTISDTQRTLALLEASNQIARALTSTLEVKEVLGLVMQKVSELLRPANWSLILQDDTGDLYFEVCVGAGSEKLRHLRIRPGEGIVGTVFQTREARLVEDVQADPTFAARFDKISEFRTRSILAVPLVSRGQALGVIELVNGDHEPLFTTEDSLILAVIADWAAIALENAHIVKRLQDLTISDEHTGLFNARHLRSLLDKEVTRARRFRHPLSLLFLDLDGFKQVNDTHGHLVGSALLREVGELLTGSIRQVDTAFRYGGDEFAVLLVETGMEQAHSVAQRVLERFRARKFLDGQALEVKVTASVGLASFPDHSDSDVGLLRAADTAMYAAKAKGRNTVCIAEAASPTQPSK